MASVSSATRGLVQLGSRARPSFTHRSSTVSSLIWSLSPALSSPNLPSLASHRHALNHRPAAWQNRSMSSRAKVERRSTEEISDDVALERMQRMLTKENQFPMDIWMLPADTLDLHLPTSPLSGNDKSIKAILSRTWQNYRNAIVNARCMHMIAKDSMFPGVYIRRPLSWNVFHARSTRDNAWVAPLRATFLDTYKKVNTAIAAGDAKALKALTTVDYHKTALERLRALHPKAGSPYTYQWKLHELRSPVRIESVRASETYMSQQEPKTGSRLLVQMLVRFDSTQTLEQYRNGQLVKGAGQATPKPVVEYLVFEKRMWYDGPWMIREQLYEGA